jgi:hypothetical protein
MAGIIIISFFIVSMLGVVTHSFHKWFKKGFLVHVFSAVNESVWEHMKLSFYPMLGTVIIHSLIPGFYYSGFWGSAFLTVITATVLVPLLYYPVRAMLGKEVPAASIGLYFVCILLAFVLEYFLMDSKAMIMDQGIAIAALAVCLAVFAVFTYFPPRVELFRDTIHNKYGEFKQKFDKKTK